RTKAVAIQFRAHNMPVAEDERRRAVPWFMVGAEGFKVLLHLRFNSAVGFECRWNQRQQRGFGTAALAHQDFHRVVEAGGVADILFQALEPIARSATGPDGAVPLS